MMSLVDRQRRHFNNVSAKYAEARRHPNHLLLKDLMWSTFFDDKDFLAISCRRVLEPMCGVAEGHEIITRYVRHDIDYRGFDYSQNMVQLAQDQHPHLKFECKDVTKFEANGQEYDLIVLIGGLHHVYAYSADVIRRLTEALRSGGYFLSFEPTHNSLLTRKAREGIYRRNSLFDAATEQGFELPELQAMFIENGYRKIDEVYAGLIAYTLYYNPDAFPSLNLGGRTTVHRIFALDKLFWRNIVGRKFSFATISLWQRQSAVLPTR